jgi:TolB-like protein/AraC-like DNA-binding protein
MSEPKNKDQEFISQLEEILDIHLSDERFGVSELAKAVNMSRSNLLRRVKKATGLSVSRFIRDYRLSKAFTMLQGNDQTVSEIAYAVGFGSTSYFTKCFRELYGFPPGETAEYTKNHEVIIQRRSSIKKYTFTSLLALAVIALVYVGLNYFQGSPEMTDTHGKSIAVLPFVNNSADVSNTYFVNGLMESVLNDLQKIEDLKVISRTSVEQYRDNPKTMPKIGEELKVTYLVEGSGQKVGDQILLNVKLIHAALDIPIWSQEFRKDASDVFDLQKEISKIITERIQVIVTPEEEERINKRYTNNLVAYDYFLQGHEALNTSKTQADLEKSVEIFAKAIEEDSSYSRAYAATAMAYYFMDVFRADKPHLDDLNYFADQALLFDDELAQALIAKSLYYKIKGDCKKAVPYLEKAISYNPNSALALNFLSDIYAICLPDTEKYLIHALKGLELNIKASDSATASINYMHVSNALVQNGFIREAEHYISKSMSYDPNNIFADYVGAYILLARDQDLAATRERLETIFAKDTTRLDVLQEVAKVCYYQRDWESSYQYFWAFDNGRIRYGLEIFKNIDGEIAYVYEKVGEIEESRQFMIKYRDYIDTNLTFSQDIELAMYYAYIGETEKAMQHFETYSKDPRVNYWSILFLDIEPLLDNIRETPEFKKLFQDMTDSFWERHDALQKSLGTIELL